MTSIIERLGSQDIPRLRMGIGRPPGRMEAADYVLQEFSKDGKQRATWHPGPWRGGHLYVRHPGDRRGDEPLQSGAWRAVSRRLRAFIEGNCIEL